MASSGGLASAPVFEVPGTGLTDPGSLAVLSAGLIGSVQDWLRNLWTPALCELVATRLRHRDRPRRPRPRAYKRPPLLDERALNREDRDPPRRAVFRADRDCTLPLAPRFTDLADLFDLGLPLEGSTEKREKVRITTTNAERILSLGRDMGIID